MRFFDEPRLGVSEFTQNLRGEVVYASRALSVRQLPGGRQGLPTIDRAARSLGNFRIAGATNGITDFFARVGTFGRVNTEEICTTRSDGTEVCASADQLAAILAGTSAGALADDGQFLGASASISAPEIAGSDADTARLPRRQRVGQMPTPQKGLPKRRPRPRAADETTTDAGAPITEASGET